MRWLELVIDVPLQAAEAAMAAVRDVVPSGLAWEERGDSVRLWVYLPEAGFQEPYRLLGHRWRRVRQAFPAVGPWAPAVRALPETDWTEAWKRHFRPLPVGRRLVIVPAWLKAEGVQAAGRLPLLLEPGMAFGTGEHASTRLALELLEQVLLARVAAPAAPPSVLDVGTGSGILAIAAALLGAGRVWAVDVDPVAVEAATANAALNGVAERIQVERGGPDRLLERLEAGGSGLPADVTVANITLDVLLPMVEELDALTRRDGAVILSGLLAQEQGVSAFVRRWEERGWRVVERPQAEGWQALYLSRV